MSTDDKEIHNRFAFHARTDITGPMHREIRIKSESLAQHYTKVLPDSREKSLALTALQEAQMWANAAVAIHLAPAIEE